MKEITKKEFTGIFKEEFENFLRRKIYLSECGFGI